MPSIARIPPMTGARGNLDIGSQTCHISRMNDLARPRAEIDDDEAELAALKAAIAKSRSDPRAVPHEEMRAWLMKVSAGEFDAPPPEARDMKL
jgi:hypothetical protein